MQIKGRTVYDEMLIMGFRVGQSPGFKPVPGRKHGREENEYSRAGATRTWEEDELRTQRLGV